MRRSLCILLVEFRALYGSTPVAEIASIIYSAGTVRHSYEELMTTMTSMIDSGSRYKNIERVLGTGSTLLLGQNVKETA
jgi:hypothetical protein